jgi:hypothetical protein
MYATSGTHGYGKLGTGCCSREEMAGIGDQAEAETVKMHNVRGHEFNAGVHDTHARVWRHIGVVSLLATV